MTRTKIILWVIGLTPVVALLAVLLVPLLQGPASRQLY